MSRIRRKTHKPKCI